METDGLIRTFGSRYGRFMSIYISIYSGYGIHIMLPSEIKFKSLFVKLKSTLGHSMQKGYLYIEMFSCTSWTLSQPLQPSSRKQVGLVKSCIDLIHAKLH